MEDRIFTDEIIPRHEERLEAKRAEEGALPERIRKMLELGARAEANGQGEERVFRLQAEFMADWDFPDLHRGFRPTTRLTPACPGLSFFPIFPGARAGRRASERWELRSPLLLSTSTSF